MNLYKIVVKPVTSFCSPLQSDTFFGAFCWSYLHQYGESALQELLHHTKTGNPDIIFSNAFPSGMLPMPCGITDCLRKEDNFSAKKERYQKYVNRKKRDHLSRISLKNFNKIINGNEMAFEDDIETEFKVLSWRNMVSREAYLVESTENENSLFEVEETYSMGTYDIYIYSTIEKDILDCTLKEMFLAGIGAQRSIGKGAFDVIHELEIFDGFETPETPNAFIALSNFIPDKHNPTEGYYKTFLKYPKVSYVSSAEDSPFKKPLIFLEAGSVFYDRPVKAFYGSCIERVAYKGGRVSDDIVIGAYTIAIPCCMSADARSN